MSESENGNKSINYISPIGKSGTHLINHLPDKSISIESRNVSSELVEVFVKLS